MQSAISLRAPVDVCSFVDDLTIGDIGQLDVVDAAGARRGTVFVQEARVCWVAAPGMAPRLQELLARGSGLDPASIQRHIERCRELRLVLADELVAREILRPSVLRDVLATHSAECLVRICDEGAFGHWTPRARDFAPRHTFSTAEVLARACASSHAGTRAWRDDVLRADLEELAEGGWSAAFVRTAGRAWPSPIAVLGAYPTHAADLLLAGRWAAGALDVGNVIAEGREHVCTRADEDTPERTMCARMAGACILVGETDSEGRSRLAKGGQRILIDDDGGVT